MALTDEERRMLEQLEAQLKNDDPEFVSALAPQEHSDESVAFGVSAKHLVFGILIAAIGLAVVVVGVAMEFVPVGILGAVVVFVGFWYVSNGAQKKASSVVWSAQSTQSGALGGAEHKSSRFMERQAAEWEKRRRERDGWGS